MASVLKVDSITGVTTAGSISVTGEGNSTTTNLQQGLAKAWLHQNTDASLDDSFNTSSTTDQGTGNYRTTFTNAFTNNFQAVPSTCAQNNDAVVYNNGRATTRIDLKIEEGGSAVDRKCAASVHGDLA